MKFNHNRVGVHLNVHDEKWWKIFDHHWKFVDSFITSGPYYIYVESIDYFGSLVLHLSEEHKKLVDKYNSEL